MSLARLEEVLASLPAVDRGLAEVAALARAAGGRRGPAETRVLRTLLLARGTTFRAEARLALARLAGLGPATLARQLHWSPRLPPYTFAIAGEHVTRDVDEPSGVAVLPGRLGLLIVDDEVGLRHVPLPRAPLAPAASRDVRVAGPRVVFRNAEGVAHDPARRSVLVLLERGTIFELRLEGAASLRLGEPREVGRLPRLRRGAGRGWEGLCVLPAATALGRRAWLLAVHERKPRRLGIFSRKTLEVEAQLTVPATHGSGRIRDLSDVTIDPGTGHVLVLSDESCALFAFELRCRRGAWRLEFVARTPLPECEAGDRLQPEGLDFDRGGNLWIACDRGRRLLYARRERYPAL
jgi:hypothetical protein